MPTQLSPSSYSLNSRPCRPCARKQNHDKKKKSRKVGSLPSPGQNQTILATGDLVGVAPDTPEPVNHGFPPVLSPHPTLPFWPRCFSTPPPPTTRPPTPEPSGDRLLPRTAAWSPSDGRRRALPEPSLALIPCHIGKVGGVESYTDSRSVPRRRLSVPWP